MSKTLSAAAIAQFESEVKHAYALEGLLRKTIRAKTGVVGSTCRFPTMGKGLATPRGSTQTDVTPMNVSHSNVTATLSDWVAPEYTDLFDQAKTNVDERANLAHVITGAITRREDQIMIDAWDAASPTQVATSIGGADTNLNTAKFRSAKNTLDAAGVPPQDRHAIIHANNLFGLLGDSDASTFDKNAIKALVDGEVNRWLGFTIQHMETRTEGGLSEAAGDVRSTYFYHGGSMGSSGMGIGVDFRVEVNYVPEKTSWLANGLFSAGAAVIDVNGLVEVLCDET